MILFRASNTLSDKVFFFTHAFEKAATFFYPIVDIILKLWIANVFFKSGLTKIQSFDSTIMLFSYEYTVPVLSPTLAAYLSTGIELICPVLLVLGLMGRVNAVALFLLNFVAAISYPDISDAGIRDHIVWGMMLLVIITNATHKVTLDYHIGRFFGRARSN